MSNHNTTHKISEAMSSQEPQAEMNFAWSKYPTRVYHSEKLGVSFGMTCTAPGGYGIHRLDFPVYIRNETMVHQAVRDAWGCGPYSITRLYIFGSCAIFYSQVDYSN